MNNMILRLYGMLENLKNSEQGQDLVEYALVVCLVSLGCIIGVSAVATAVTAVFTNISNSLA